MTLKRGIFLKILLCLSAFLGLVKVSLDVRFLTSGKSQINDDAIPRDMLPPKLKQERDSKNIFNDIKLTDVRNNRSTEKKQMVASDGSFNNIPLEFRENSIHSTISCIGENFQKNSWWHRSCEFQNMCFDMDKQTFVIFQTHEQHSFEQIIKNQSEFYHISTTNTDLHVAIGGLNPKWRLERKKLEWFPDVVVGELSTGYYALPPDSVWLPFHSLAGYNPGHLMWDDFFPLYKLLRMFGKSEDSRLVLIRMPIKLWGDCDWNPKREEQCGKMIPKFLPAMGITNKSFSTPHDFTFSSSETNKRRSKYVCAPVGLAGMGMLTDHGEKLHGWDKVDYETTVNTGRGPMFFGFRNFVMKNLGLPNTHKERLGPPYHVVFSKFSSDTVGRVKGFGRQVAALEKHFRRDYVIVECHRMSRLSLVEQAALTSKAAIFVTVTGGGAVTSTFIPPGSSLILFYEATGGRARNKETGEPAMLDWDLLNHASFLRVHWLPVENLDGDEELSFFVELVRNELHIIEQREKNNMTGYS